MSTSLVELAYMVTPDVMTVPSDARKAESTGSIQLAQRADAHEEFDEGLG